MNYRQEATDFVHRVAADPGVTAIVLIDHPENIEILNKANGPDEVFQLMIASLAMMARVAKVSPSSLVQGLIDAFEHFEKEPPEMHPDSGIEYR